jgi:hypothetical protein
LFGIKWAFDNNVVLNLKKSKISFEIDTPCLVAPLDHIRATDTMSPWMRMHGYRSLKIFIKPRVVGVMEIFPCG